MPYDSQGALEARENEEQEAFGRSAHDHAQDVHDLIDERSISMAKHTRKPQD